MLPPTSTLSSFSAERLAQGRGHLLGRLHGIGDALDPRQQDRELVAAQPRDGVAAGQGAAQPLRDRLEQQVAVGVAKRVVDLLEAVEVDHDDAEAGVGAAAAHRLLGAHREEGPVGQAGEGVVQGLMVVQRGLPAAEVDRTDRQHQQQDQERAEVGGHDHHGREADQHRGRRGLEAEVVPEVPEEGVLVGQGRRDTGEGVVREEEDGAGREDRRQVGRARSAAARRPARR